MGKAVSVKCVWHWVFKKNKEICSAQYGWNEPLSKIHIRVFSSRVYLILMPWLRPKATCRYILT